MYVTDSPVSEEAQQLLRERCGAFRRWFDVAPVPPDAWLPRYPVELAPPPLALYATPEEVKRLYPEPPAPLTPSPTTTTREAALDSPLRAPAVPVSSSSGSGQAPVAPRAHFTPGFTPVDYLGRTFVAAPPALVQQAERLLRKPCEVPRTLRGTFKLEPLPSEPESTTEAEKAVGGVQLVRWAPPAFGHLLFAGTLQGGAALWHSQTRGLLARYAAHTRPIKSLEVTHDGALMSTASLDGTVAMWDVDAGVCKGVLTNLDGLPALQHLHHPTDPDHLLVALDRKVALYDVRVSLHKYQREYTGHRGAIFNLTLLRDATKMLTTSEDKTLRTWDYRIAVQIKQFADAGMHAITHVLHHPQQPELLAAQSLDNKVLLFKDMGAGKLNLLRHREFTGHNISGTRCQLGFSHDGRYLSSGDIEGSLLVWDWAAGKLVKSFKAHSQMLVSHAWHPLEPSRVVTASWDGSIKNWI